MQELLKISYIWLVGGLLLLLLVVSQLRKLERSCMDNENSDLSSEVKDLGALLKGLLKEVEDMSDNSDCKTFVKSVVHPDGTSDADLNAHRQNKAKTQ